MAPNIRLQCSLVITCGPSPGSPRCACGFRPAPPESIVPSVLPEHNWSFDFGVWHRARLRSRQPPTGAGLEHRDRRLARGPPRDREFVPDCGSGTTGAARKPTSTGRLFDYPTFGTNHDDFANLPSSAFAARFCALQSSEIGAEERLFLPAEHGSEAGIMFGVPFLFHLGHIARIDTGVYVPVLFYNPVDAYISLPIDVWFQATPRFWLGPITGVVIHPSANHADVPFGLGLGYQAVRNVDLKTQFLFPALNDTQGAQTFGFGVAIEVRIE